MENKQGNNNGCIYSDIKLVLVMYLKGILMNPPLWGHFKTEVSLKQLSINPRGTPSKHLLPSHHTVDKLDDGSLEALHLGNDVGSLTNHVSC